MTPRLQAAIARAAALSGAAQDDLADAIDAFLARARWGAAGAEPFTDDEIGALDRLAAESFADADLAEVAALVGRRGAWTL